jgi:2,3-bisphosphoglycerate-dependent phosphoglycerate mutase
MSSTLILLRHGQSEWNQKNIFTGFVDVALSEMGVQEAQAAHDLLSAYNVDAVYTSALKRAQDTAAIALKGRMPSKCFSSAALNERHYGELQGKNKDEMRKLYGDEQIALWRRSFDMRPPGGESLKDTCDRVMPYFHDEIEPRLKLGETVLIAAHGNSLRALVKFLEHLSDAEIVSIEIETGKPIVYELDDNLGIMNKKILIGKEQRNERKNI